MRGKLVIAGALLGAVSLTGAPANATSAPDPYSGGIDTSCSIQVPAVVEPGDAVVIRVTVAANSPTPPTGELDLAIATDPGGDTVWAKTVPYSGGTKRVVGPVLPKDEYRATARFRPSDQTFDGCRDAAAFAVRVGGQDDDDDGDNPGGTLPDTGGPAALWLILGLSLVGGGVATVAYARRRATAPRPA